MKAWLCLGFESGLNLTSREDKDQWGLLYCLHYRETCAPTCAEHNFWAICRSQLVQVDWPVSYPLVFIHLRDVDPYNPRWTSHRMSNMQYYIITSDFGYKNLKQWSKDSLKIKYIFFKISKYYEIIENLVIGNYEHVKKYSPGCMLIKFFSLEFSSKFVLPTVN